MLQLIKKWIDGPREFFTGVAIYRKLPDKHAPLLQLLSQGPSDIGKQKLLEALKAAYTSLQAQELVNPEHTGVTVRKVVLKPQEPVNTPQETPIEAVPVNEPLYKAAKTEADNLYKQVMNARAELFAMARYDGMTDPNLPDLIEQRRPLAVDLVKAFKKVSELYDRADYVKKHGRLPDIEIPAPDEELLEEIPDAQVKQKLDNLRKIYNKTKAKPVTAERALKLQKWEVEIKILEQRWHLLK